MRAGRHHKMTPERTAALLNGLRLGMTRRAAAGAVGISHTTFYTMCEDVTFLAAVEKAEAEAEARYQGLVARAAEDPKTWQAAAWWLERRRHQDYALRAKVDMTVDIKVEAERLATEYGIDADAAIAEAERVLAGG